MPELTLEEQAILEELLNSRLAALRKLFKDAIDLEAPEDSIKLVETELDLVTALTSKVVLYAP